MGVTSVSVLNNNHRRGRLAAGILTCEGLHVLPFYIITALLL